MGSSPTDAEIIALADETRTGEPGRDGYILPISFARAVLARWGQPSGALSGMSLLFRDRLYKSLVSGSTQFVFFAHGCAPYDDALTVATG